MTTEPITRYQVFHAASGAVLQVLNAEGEYVDADPIDVLGDLTRMTLKNQDLRRALNQISDRAFTAASRGQ